MQLDIVNSEEGFHDLRSEWNRLANEFPFASWEWYRRWWEHIGRTSELAIGVLRDGERIVALAPWYWCRHPLRGRVLRFLASGETCSDYQTILAQPAELASAVECLGDALATEGRSSLSQHDLLDYEGVACGDATMKALCEILVEHGYQVSAEPIESSWVVGLPASWTDFLAQLPKNTRRKVRKAISRIESGEFTFHQTDTPDDLERFWPEFVRLHQKRFVGTKSGGCFHDERFESFLKRATRDLLVSGRARLFWCEHGGQPFAAQLYFQSKQIGYMYQSGFDPEKASWEPGYLLYTYVFQRLIQEGISALDFLRGNEPYKARWSAEPVPLQRLRCVPPRLSSRLRQNAYNAGRRMKRAAVAYWGILTPPPTPPIEPLSTTPEGYVG